MNGSEIKGEVVKLGDNGQDQELNVCIEIKD